MAKHVLVVIAAAIVLPSGIAAGSSTTDQRLADALVVRKADGPSYWMEFKATRGGLSECLAKARDATAYARSSVGGPNTGVDSLATVFPGDRQAYRYYRDALPAVAACVRRWVALRHPRRAWDAQPLTVGRYGRRSGAWRLRYIDGTLRKSVDWALVDTGRAVLVDVASIAWYDDQWQDTGAGGALGATGLTIERRILRNATRRGAAATRGG